MARQTIKTVLKQRVKKSDVGTHPCPYCNGTGRKKNVGRGAK